MALFRCTLGSHTACLACGDQVLASRPHSHDWIGKGTYGTLCSECHRVVHRAAQYVLEALADYGFRELTYSKLNEILEDGTIGLLIQAPFEATADRN